MDLDTDINLAQQLIDDLKSDSNSNTVNLGKRLLCYELHIASDATTNNSFRKDWKTAKFIADYSAKILV